ncbi:MAG: glycosyltransferase family 9 protein [bacterium]|jgi:ADP-heptose:LPS heptosyltransferase
MNIFIFQTRRIGDFFQSVPLIDSLASADGDEAKKIDILIDESIYDIKNIFNTEINFITYESILNPLGISVKCLNKFDKFLLDLTSEYELAVNLNYDFANSLFLNFFKNQKKGFIVLNKSKKTAESISRSGPANYLFNIVKNRSLNRINITDIYSLIGNEKTAEIKTSYGIIKLKKKIESKKKRLSGEPVRICISIGATHQKRIWQSENYAKLISLLSLNLNCEIIIVGTAEESSAAEEIKQKLPEGLNVIDLTGKTNLNELIYLIKDFDLIIASDTGTLHIAQIFNVPSVSLYTGNANFYETGPHVENSYVIHSVIQCYPCMQHEPCRFNYACKNDINPEDVFNLALMQIIKNKLHYSFKEQEIKFSDVKKRVIANVKKGNFSVAVCKHLSSIHFYPLYKRKISKNDFASEILKFCWINVLSKNSIKIDKNNVLRYTNKYYKIDESSLNSLIKEIDFIKGVFKNASKSFNKEYKNDEYAALYFEKFKNSVKSLGLNYSYFKLACDYFIDELNFSGAQKSFNDIILLLDNAIDILKMF